MAAKVAWLRAAVADLEEIGNYIARDSESYSKVAVTKLYEAAMQLADFPRMGRRVPE